MYVQYYANLYCVIVNQSSVQVFSSPLSRPKMVFVTLIFNAWTQRYVIVLSKRRFCYFPHLWPQFCAPHQSAPCLQKGGRRASTALCTFVSLIEPSGFFFFFFHRIEKIIEPFFVARLSVWRSGAASKVGWTKTWRNWASIFITGNPKNMRRKQLPSSLESKSDPSNYLFASRRWNDKLFQAGLFQESVTPSPIIVVKERKLCQLLSVPSYPNKGYLLP